jgi:hypothetical protein
MPDPTVDPQPTRGFRIPRMEATISNLGLSYTSCVRDERTGVVSVSVGTVDQRVTLADDPGVLAALLDEARVQVLEVSRQR